MSINSVTHNPAIYRRNQRFGAICSMRCSTAEIEGPAVKREKPDFRRFGTSLTIARFDQKKEEEEPNAKKSTLQRFRNIGEI